MYRLSKWPGRTPKHLLRLFKIAELLEFFNVRPFEVSKEELAA